MREAVGADETDLFLYLKECRSLQAPAFFFTFKSTFWVFLCFKATA